MFSRAQLLPARTCSPCTVCLQKWMCMHVCPRAAPGACVSQALSGKRRLSVRRLTLVCPHSAMPFRHVPVALPPLLPLSPPHLLMLLERVLSEESQHRNQPARDAIIPASLDRPTCCDADIKHRDREGGRYEEGEPGENGRGREAPSPPSN